MILENISENLCSLRKVICASTDTGTKLEPGGGSHLLSSEGSAAVGEKEKQMGEHRTFPKIKEEAWDPELDSLVKHEAVDVFRKQVKQEKGGFEDEMEDSLLREVMERTCLMPSISEYDLQDLEQQAKEEKHNAISHQFSEVLNREGIIYSSAGGLLCCTNAQRTNILVFRWSPLPLFRLSAVKQPQTHASSCACVLQ